MPEYIDCRCPGCSHIRAQAAEGSFIQIKCRQCKMFVQGRVFKGKFRVTSTQEIRVAAIKAVNPPTFRG